MFHQIVNMGAVWFVFNVREAGVLN